MQGTIFLTYFGVLSSNLLFKKNPLDRIFKTYSMLYSTVKTELLKNYHEIALLCCIHM